MKLTIDKIALQDLDKVTYPTGVFGSIQWLQLFQANKLSVWGVFNKNKELVGHFHTYTYKRAKVFNQWAPAPFTPHNGLVFHNQASNPSSRNTNVKTLMKTLSMFLKKQAPALLTFVLPPELVDTQPFVWDTFKVSPRYTYRMDLTLSKEELLKNLSFKRRNALTKFEKSTYELGTVLSPILLDKIEDTLRVSGENFDTTLLKQIASCGIEKTCSTLDKEDELVGGNVCLHDNDMAYCLLSTTSKTDRIVASYALWNSILQCKDKGVKTFDFEGSMVPSIEQFFRGFGGKLTPYYKISKGFWPFV